MPYFDTSQAWLHHSSLLLQAQPTSTRITTKYTLTPPTKTSKPKSSRLTNPPPPSSDPSHPQQQQLPPTSPQQSHQQQPSTRGTLILKTYSPVSGVCLKYRTDKAAEVGRLISSLGRLSRYMSGLPVKKDEVEDGVGVGVGVGGRDVVMGEVPQGTGTSTPVGEMVAGPAGKEGKEGKEGKGVGVGEKGKAGGGAGGKKKKGKK